jgi:hypothetical protein
MSDIRVECPQCGDSKFTLGWAYGHNWHCSGRFPEREPFNSPPIKEKCDEHAKIIQRQASNLRIPELLTLFSMPPRHTDLHSDLQTRPIYYSLAGNRPTSSNQLKQILDNLVKIGLIGEDMVSKIMKEPWREIQSAIDVVLAPVDRSYHNLLAEEFAELVKGSTQGIPPVHGSAPHSPVLIEINPHLVMPAKGINGTRFRITPVLKLRTVTVQRGYRRAIDIRTLPQLVDVSFPDSINPQQKWYPGVEFLGEGIFVIFDTDDGHVSKMSGKAVDNWMSAFNDSSSYPEYVFRCPNAREELHPLFIWWHTLSHLLIRAIATEAGYSAASIRERIYFENASSGPRGGILLFATQPGSEGTLGGLVALVPYFQDMLDMAFEQLRVCSGDPLCGDQKFTLGHYNGAACYGCLLLSETSCDHRNMWLDRNVVLENLP